MNATERQVFNAKVAELLHWGLVTIRSCTYPLLGEADRREEVNDLADLLHNLPRYIVGHDEHAVDTPEQLREAVIQHVRRFYPSIDPTSHSYVVLLDTDSETFLARYRDHHWPEPESALPIG